MKFVVLPGLLHHSGDIPDDMKDDTNLWKDDSSSTPNTSQQRMIDESVRRFMRPKLDFGWHEFLNCSCADDFRSIKRDSMDPCNILFSSGTTGEPKAIVWSHSTPIKCAVDGHYHQNIGPGSVAVWPTNIGWMMGPWLLYQMINGATIGLFLNGQPSSWEFCKFVEKAKVTMLGVIPSIVKAWRATDHHEGVDWSSIKTFSSTGEASDPIDMLWLMSRVKGYAPVIEYCGGTEIGGSFLSSTVVQPNVPSMFSTPVLGSRVLLVDSDEGYPLEISSSSLSSEIVDDNDVVLNGEITLVPPSIGLSTHLLNRNHYNTYYEGMKKGPKGEVLRRHGDEIERVKMATMATKIGENNDKNSYYYYRALGRSDDTMNIGGIKVGSAEIERVCNLVESVRETAAIAIGSPSKLVLFCVLNNNDDDKKITSNLKRSMQKEVNKHLNPLFKIHDIILRESLPRTASNKVMRRFLRDEYPQEH